MLFSVVFFFLSVITVISELFIHNSVGAVVMLNNRSFEFGCSKSFIVGLCSLINCYLLIILFLICHGSLENQVISVIFYLNTWIFVGKI